MTQDDRQRDGKGAPPDAAATRVLDEEEAEELASAETRVLDSDEIASAETMLVAETAPPAASDEDATLLVGDVDETVIDRSAAEQDPASKATRVLDSLPAAGALPTAGAPSAAGARSAAGAQPAAGAAAPTPDSGALAETRVLEDSDKTSPPAVHAPERDRAAAATPPATTPIDSERGLPPGMILFGEYEIVNVLGVGGMGEVYRAKHRRLEEHRAIKVMHAELATKKGASEFFYREAKALLAVRHPAVVHCHDLLSDDQGRVYLIMEMIEGIPLSKKMNDGPLSTDEVAILGARVAHGLTAAHRKGVIHRDLSPDNIVLPNGRVQEAKIIDFGIAKLLQDGEGTILDGFKGKLSYASPEQLGFFGGKIDGRSDFYSLGLVLVAAALGRPIGMGSTVVEAVDARRSFKTLPDAIPIGLRSAILPLLALDPKDRPEHVDRLFVAPAGLDPAAVDTGFRQPVSKSSGASLPVSGQGPNRAGMIAGIAAAAALLLGGGLYSVMGGEGSPSEETPTEASVQEPVADAPPSGVAAVAVAEPPTQAEAAPTPVAKKPPEPRRLSAGDRIKIIGLISNAKLALSEDRLMSPANDNAFDRYRKVLELDPSDERAKKGLYNIAGRYVSLAGQAIDRADKGEAQTYVDRAKRADPDHPEIEAVEARIRR